MKFRVGDIVVKNDGTCFSDGKFETTITNITGIFEIKNVF